LDYAYFAIDVSSCCCHGKFVLKGREPR